MWLKKNLVFVFIINYSLNFYLIKQYISIGGERERFCACIGKNQSIIYFAHKIQNLTIFYAKKFL